MRHSEFKIGQSVFYYPTARPKVEGRYIVMRLVPQLDGEVRYRIRSQDDGSREYTASESELRTGVAKHPGQARR
jgi:hypothetical protein